jgi:hypothetical protein
MVFSVEGTRGRYRGTKEYFLILAELIQTARYRGTVTYQELADLVGLPLVGAFMGNELGGYLGTISKVAPLDRLRGKS